MKRVAAILFLSIMLLSQTELHQILKFPVFVQHYFEHQAEDPNITLSQFIVLHYFSGNPVDDDYARDMQLPFKSNDCLGRSLWFFYQKKMDNDGFKYCRSHSRYYVHWLWHSYLFQRYLWAENNRRYDIQNIDNDWFLFNIIQLYSE